MSKKRPVNIKIRGDIEVEPGGVFLSEVVKSGNGAVVKFFKKFLGEEVLIMVVNKMKRKQKKEKKMSKEDLMDLADYTEDAHLYPKKGEED